MEYFLSPKTDDRASGGGLHTPSHVRHSSLPEKHLPTKSFSRKATLTWSDTIPYLTWDPSTGRPKGVRQNWHRSEKPSPYLLHFFQACPPGRISVVVVLKEIQHPAALVIAAKTHRSRLPFIVSSETLCRQRALPLGGLHLSRPGGAWHLRSMISLRGGTYYSLMVSYLVVMRINTESLA